MESLRCSDPGVHVGPTRRSSGGVGDSVTRRLARFQGGLGDTAICESGMSIGLSVRRELGEGAYDVCCARNQQS